MFNQVYERMLAGDSCIVPVNSEYANAEGEVQGIMMAWGNPTAYMYIVRHGKLYAVPRYGVYELGDE